MDKLSILHRHVVKVRLLTRASVSQSCTLSQEAFQIAVEVASRWAQQSGKRCPPLALDLPFAISKAHDCYRIRIAIGYRK